MSIGAAVQISDLKERQARGWGIIHAMDRPPINMVTKSMERLAKLIEKAEPILQASLPVDTPGSFQSSRPVIVNDENPVTNKP
jgi:hypothetical protein